MNLVLWWCHQRIKIKKIEEWNKKEMNEYFVGWLIVSVNKYSMYDDVCIVVC